MCAAFALDRPPSWFEQPQRDDPMKIVDTRRFRLGMVLERLLPGGDPLIARTEAFRHFRCGCKGEARDVSECRPPTDLNG